LCALSGSIGQHCCPDLPTGYSHRPLKRRFTRLIFGRNADIVRTAGREWAGRDGRIAERRDALRSSNGPGGRSMKLVIAVIKPFKLEEVRDALVAVGVHGMTVTEVKGYGRQKGHTEIYRGAEYAVNFLPKMRIEVAVPTERVSAVVDAIITSAKTGQIGDGKIFVTTIDQAVRIRTGETDADAL
jgi:nitrogen regulatory protein P-II 2